METVSSRATRSKDGSGPTEQTPTIGTLEGTRRHLPELRPANHKRNGLAQPPHRPQSERWKQQDREPRPCPPQLPYAGSCHKGDRNETVSQIEVRTGHLGALFHA